MNLQNLLNIEFPIIQAPMAGVQGSAMAIAVSNAGGLGSLPCAMLDTNELRSELQTVKAGTSHPFNLNFFAHTSPEPNEQQELAWREALAPYYDELGIDTSAITAGAGRKPFDSEAATFVEEFRPAVVSFHFGLPELTLLQRVKAAGAKVLSTATTVEEALWLQQHGADAVIAQGLEAGGHRGHFLSKDLSRQMGTFALVPQMVAALDIPVIAAGGIADSPGVQAAIRLGAAGVQLGTAFLLCHEANTKPVHRDALKYRSQHTALTNLFTGGAARGIVNRVIQELGPISESAPEFPMASTAIAPLRAAAEAKNSGDFSPLWAGQNTSGCQEVAASELLRQLVI
ncbi:NAD(P)H-dependent flavin oxidoreductase [Marinobacter sp.]|uniref:NAD(P)H-dependent flavin oxidoreductase n=1 Tax=Marinobacter sp. TaxID=50741 RepID=UPI00356595D9